MYSVHRSCMASWWNFHVVIYIQSITIHAICAACAFKLQPIEPIESVCHIKLSKLLNSSQKHDSYTNEPNASETVRKCWLVNIWHSCVCKLKMHLKCKQYFQHHVLQDIRWHSIFRNLILNQILWLRKRMVCRIFAVLKFILLKNYRHASFDVAAIIRTSKCVTDKNLWRTFKVPVEIENTKATIHERFISAECSNQFRYAHTIRWMEAFLGIPFKSTHNI